MNLMSHRERVLAALSHRPPDRVPIDLGSTPVTGIAAQAYDRLKARWGLTLGPTRIYDRAAQLAVVDERVLELIGVDTRGIKPGLPDSRPLIEARDEDAFTDEWGIVRKRPPDAHTYFIANAPLAGEISLHDILRYPWPPPDDPRRTRGLRERALRPPCARRLRHRSPHCQQFHPAQSNLAWLFRLVHGCRVQSQFADGVA